MRTQCIITLVCAVAFAAAAHADFIVTYTQDAGGLNTEPLNGLAARATFSLSGTQLSILLENISTGVPASFEVSDSLLVSLGMNLPVGVLISSGNTAVVGPGAVGIGSWSGRTAGHSVAEEWLWTNDYGGDLMETFAQVISTSSGQGGGTVTGFGGGIPQVGGPFGGIAAAPPLLAVPPSKPAVSDAILFELTLTSSLSPAELATMAAGSIVEFGSDQRYLHGPEPAALWLMLAAAAGARRRT